MTRKDQLRPIGSRLFGQNWLTRLAAVPAGMVFMGGRRTGGYSLEDYSDTRLQMRTFPTLKCIMFSSLCSQQKTGYLNNHDDYKTRDQKLEWIV